MLAFNDTLVAVPTAMMNATRDNQRSFPANNEQAQRNAIAEQALMLAETDVASAMQFIRAQLPYEFMLHANE